MVESIRVSSATHWEESWQIMLVVSRMFELAASTSYLFNAEKNRQIFTESIPWIINELGQISEKDKTFLFRIFSQFVEVLILACENEFEISELYQLLKQIYFPVFLSYPIVNRSNFRFSRDRIY